MSEPISVLIVDDHLPLRIGLAAMLESRPEFRVAGEAATGEEAIAACATHPPDVVLMDLRLPGCGGVEATMEIRRRWPDTRVVILTTFEGEEDIHRAIHAGACGCLLKGLSAEELYTAVLEAHRGGRVMPPAVAARLRERVLRKDLSPREIEVLRLIVAGRSNKEIARDLAIGGASVKSHLKSLFQKLGVADRTQAAIEAVRSGLVHIEG